ncbi:MAG: c-type cytochrome [Acidobacteria bacterium]|nr:c-type cytochrome [Acidobacteriota bacterium]MBI3655215.1 c-type cytochrome [Acidobacteriota bacterium]
MPKKFLYGILALIVAVMAAFLFLRLGKDRARGGATNEVAKVTVDSKAGPTPAVLDLGKKVYEMKCATCHGGDGKGDGEAAFVLYPKPRDFTLGVFKIRSTESGSPPTDDDLFRTITQGMAGTSMPAWRSLSENERWALVHYVKTFSPRFKSSPSPQAIAIAGEPAATPDSIAEGKKVYETQKCWNCHGQLGKGDGPAAATLQDDRGYPIKPYDFTRGARFKGGSGGADVYRTFITGMDGTPMPSFSTIAETQRWQLVHYVKSMSKNGKPAASEVEQVTRSISSRYVKEAIPAEDVSASIWEKATAFEVPLRSLWLKDVSVEKLSVRSLHNDRDLAFLLEWEDAVADQDNIKVQDFRDAAAVQFSLTDREPFFGMGEKNGLVNIWHWKADWQKDMGHRQDMENQYSRLAADFYPTNERPASQVIPTAQHDPAYLSGLAAGNAFSQLSRSSPVEDLNAAGMGTLTAQPPKAQNVKGRGVWAEGKWRVLMVRPLNSPDAGDAKFPIGKAVPVAFAIWNGADHDRNGQKSVSVWYPLQLEGK